MSLTAQFCSACGRSYCNCLSPFLNQTCPPWAMSDTLFFDEKDILFACARPRSSRQPLRLLLRAHQAAPRLRAGAGAFAASRRSRLLRHALRNHASMRSRSSRSTICLSSSCVWILSFSRSVMVGIPPQGHVTVLAQPLDELGLLARLQLAPPGAKSRAAAYIYDRGSSDRPVLPRTSRT